MRTHNQLHYTTISMKVTIFSVARNTWIYVVHFLFFSTFKCALQSPLNYLNEILHQHHYEYAPGSPYQSISDLTQPMNVRDTQVRTAHHTRNSVPCSLQITSGFYLPASSYLCTKGWDGVYRLSSLFKNTRECNHLQMSLQRQHFLISYLKTSISTNWTNQLAVFLFLVTVYFWNTSLEASVWKN